MDFWHVMKLVQLGLDYGPGAPGPHAVRALQTLCIYNQLTTMAPSLLSNTAQADH